jgi:2'-5' RNA ligase
MKVSLPEPTSYVVLRFDHEATASVQRIKESMSKFYEVKLIKSKPHITFTDWVGGREELFQKLNYFCENQPAFKFTLWSVGSFGNRGAVFLKPKDKGTFTRLHYYLVQCLGDPKSEYLKPGLWEPHCTIVKGLKKNLLKHAELQVTTDFEVCTAKAIGFEIITRGQEPWFVPLEGLGPKCSTS